MRVTTVRNQDLLLSLDRSQLPYPIDPIDDAAADSEFIELSLQVATQAMIEGSNRGSVPVAASGIGTRRLVGLAIQSFAVREGVILFIDEIECGLEAAPLARSVSSRRGSRRSGALWLYLRFSTGRHLHSSRPPTWETASSERMLVGSAE